MLLYSDVDGFFIFFYIIEKIENVIIKKQNAIFEKFLNSWYKTAQEKGINNWKQIYNFNRRN